LKGFKQVVIAGPTFGDGARGSFPLQKGTGRDTLTAGRTKGGHILH